MKVGGADDSGRLLVMISRGRAPLWCHVALQGCHVALQGCCCTTGVGGAYLTSQLLACVDTHGHLRYTWTCMEDLKHA